MFYHVRLTHVWRTINVRCPFCYVFEKLYRTYVWKHIWFARLKLNIQILYSSGNIKSRQYISDHNTCLELKQYFVVLITLYQTVQNDIAKVITFGALLFIFFNYFVWLRITDDGSVPEMCIWSILLIKSDLKWCICHLRRSLLLYYNFLISRRIWNVSNI